MTIQTIFGNDDEPGEVKSQIYRQVIKNVNLDKYIQGFFAQRDTYRWGKLIQLKGKDRIVLRTFGKYSNGETVTH